MTFLTKELEIYNKFLVKNHKKKRIYLAADSHGKKSANKFLEIFGKKTKRKGS